MRKFAPYEIFRYNYGTWPDSWAVEHPEIHRAICMVDRVKLLGIIKINVTRRNTAISYFPR